MKRDELKALGLEDKVIDSVMEMYGKDVTAIKSKNEAYEKQIQTYEANIAESNKKLAELSNSAKGQEELTKKIQELTDANTKTVNEYQTKLKDTTKRYLFAHELEKVHAKNAKAVGALFDYDKLEVKGDGDEAKLEGFNEQYNNLYKGNEYLFGETIPSKAGSQISGAKTPENPYGFTSEQMAFAEAAGLNIKGNK